MSQFLKTIDKYNKVFLNEDTNLEAKAAADDFTTLLGANGIKFKKDKLEDTYFILDLPNGGSVLVSVHGYKTTPKGKAAVSEDEEAPIGTPVPGAAPANPAVPGATPQINPSAVVANDPEVVKAQTNALTKLKASIDAQMNATRGAATVKAPTGTI